MLHTLINTLETTHLCNTM